MTRFPILLTVYATVLTFFFLAFAPPVFAIALMLGLLLFLPTPATLKNFGSPGYSSSIPKRDRPIGK